MNRRAMLTQATLACAALGGAPRATKAASQRPLGLRYLDTTRELLTAIRATETDMLLEAAYHVADTVKRGNTCFSQWDMGHNIAFDLFPDRHGDPGLFVTGFDEDAARKGDLLLMSIIGAPMNDPHEKGLFVIGGPAPWCGETPNPELLRPQNRVLKYRHFSDLWIDTGISTHGAVMWLPGSSVPTGPTSGVLGLMTFWMIIADAARILARDGAPMTVAGDEPPLGDNAAYVSPDAPLGRAYFAEAMRQISAIEAEFGTVDNIAELAVDTVLAGGHVYNYSTHPNSLSYESVYRRGGLLLNRSVMAGDNGPVGGPHFGKFEGKAGDLVIMGVWQPDEPRNLRDMAAFRKRGMRVVSIGAATRDGRVPEGDTVPGLADLHLGAMCDTYGLFAIPGVARKVCPTSGLLINQMFYSVQMQIAEKIMERTGNVPRIDANAAMIGGLDKRRRDLEIIKVRGY